MKINYAVVCAFSTFLVLSGCGVGLKPEVPDIITKVDEAIDSTSNIVSTEIESKPTVRRMEAITYYINNGDLPADQNFNSKKPKESFALFVCTGAGALRKDLAAIKYTKAYSSAIKGISSLGEDSFSGQLKKLVELQLPAEKLPTPDSIKAKDVFESCIQETLQNLNGYPASDVTGEVAPLALIAAIQASQELLKSIETLAKDGIKTANKFVVGKKLKEFDQANREELLGVLSTDLSDVRLDNAWERRKAVSLYQSFETFKKLLKLPRTNSEDILALGQLASSQLSTFDLMRKTESPSNIVKRLRILETHLHSVITDNEINPEKIILYINYLSKDLEAIKKDYEEVNTAWKDAKPKIVEALK